MGIGPSVCEGPVLPTLMAGARNTMRLPVSESLERAGPPYCMAQYPRLSTGLRSEQCQPCLQWKWGLPQAQPGVASRTACHLLKCRSWSWWGSSSTHYFWVLELKLDPLVLEVRWPTLSFNRLPFMAKDSVSLLELVLRVPGTDPYLLEKE